MPHRSADISTCGRFRWSLVRAWDARPNLLVVMFNPSTADAQRDDPTISLLCHIASWNGFGSITVVNLIPLRTSDPTGAVESLRWKDQSHNHENARAVIQAAAKAKAILLAWGTLAARAGGYERQILAAIKLARPSAEFFCLGTTAEGYPIHPLARGKRKIPKTQTLVPLDPSTFQP